MKNNGRKNKEGATAVSKPAKKQRTTDEAAHVASAVPRDAKGGQKVSKPTKKRQTQKGKPLG